MNDRLPSAPAHRAEVAKHAAGPGVYSPEPESYRGDDVEFRDIWATIRRRRHLILVTLASVVAIVAIWTWAATPVWEASTLIRVAEQGGGGVPVLDVLTTLQRGSELETEMRILRTRPIVERVVDDLDLNFVVVQPAELPRALFFPTFEFDQQTPPGEYEIQLFDSGRYRIESRGDDTPPVGTEFRAGEVVTIPGGSFVLADLEQLVGPNEDPVPTGVRIRTLGFQSAVEGLFEALTVTRPDREANVIRVSYVSTDRSLAYDVPNAIAASFIEQRNAVQKTEARSTVQFLEEQSDQIRSQLEAAENELQTFREGSQIVALGVEAQASVERLADLQTERTQLDAERTALANLLNEIESGVQEPDYRRLAAFPTFLQNDVIADILQELIAADRARTELLVRVTPSHPDLIGVENRIADLEGQLGAIGTNYLGSLNDQVASLDAVLARFGSELEEIPQKEVQFARLERQVTTLAELYTLLQTRLKEAQVAEAVEDPSVRVVEEAILPLEPISPKPVRNMALAGVLGLMLGIGLAFVREYMDRTLHSSDQIEQLYGLPTIARIPSMPIANGRNGDHRSKTLVTAGDSHSVGAEAFRNLRTNVRFVREGRGASEVVVTSPAPQEGKSVTSANLAIAFAQQGVRTLLVDADMRRSVLHRKFGMERTPGLSDLLVGDQSPKDVIRPTQVENLYLLPAGGHPPNPAELVGGARMEQLLEKLRDRFEAIVIDSPPMLAVTDASVLGPKTDGVILVVRAEKTDKDAIALAVQQLRHVGAEILGVVVNDARPDGVYYSYYRKYYGEPSSTGIRGLLERTRDRIQN